MIERTYPNLLTPFSVRGVYFRNRIFLPSCAIAHVTDGAPNDLGIGYLEEKARGGAAQITQGNITGPGGPGDNSGHLNRYMTNWKTQMAFTELAWAIKQHGAVASGQINHAGMLAGVEENCGTLPMSSTGFVRNDFHTHVGDQSDGVQVVEMTEKMIEDCVTYYGNVAKFIKACGFQMCMLHAGHEMLINQFLSPRYNKRRDRFGGSPENRIRFPKMVLERIRDVVGDDFPIEVRISADDHHPEGKGIEESIYFIKEVENIIDFVHCSSGSGGEAAYLTQSVVYQPEGLNAKYAEAMKKAGVKPLVIAMGGIVSPDVAERIIAEGRADIVSMARALMADPEYPAKLRRNEPEEIVPCLRCQNCLGGEKAFYLTRCMVNPTLGHEARVRLQAPATRKRKVLIIGGGPAGMQAAITAHDRGHEVILAERDDALGGTIRFADHDSIKYTLKNYKDYLVRQINKRGIEVRLNTEAGEELVDDVKPESTIVAVGADPIVPRIPGLDLPHVMYATDVYKNPEKVGKKVAAIGGGLVGCEIGLHLAKTGHEVEVIEMLGELARDDNMIHKQGMEALWAELPIHGNLNTKVIEVTEKGVLCEDQGGSRKLIEADTVIYSIGLRPRADVFEKMRHLCYDVVSVGDCVKSAKIVDAVHAGWNAAIDLA